jgi:neutral trehalase
VLANRAAQNRAMAEEVAAAMRRKLWSEKDGFFYSYDSRGGGLLTTPTVSSLVPLMGEIASPEQAAQLIEHLGSPAEFWTEVPVPSTSAASPSFNPLRYWSGPTWPVTNWLVIRGLRERNSSMAEELRLSTLKMIAEGADAAVARRRAMQVLELNSLGEQFTTPSKKQYAHAWLWDSAIVALSWPAVAEKPQSYSPQAGDPKFWEYYHPRTGEPLGAPLMSWTASLLIELRDID